MVLFLVGVSVGSFVNVLVWRYGRKKSALKGRSICDSCGRQLCWWENIPVFSFLILRGKCRTCHSPIPFEYPIVELVMGGIYLLITNYSCKAGFCSSGQFLNFALAACYLLLATLLAIVFLFDLHYRIIPDEATIALVVVSLLIHTINHQSPNSNFLISGIGFSVFLLILHLFTKGKGMGMGDVKFAFFMGFFLGWPKILAAFYLAFLTGAVVGVILVLLKKKKFGQKIAFGPFLAGSTFIAWFWGEVLIKWFTKWIIKG